MERRLRQLEKKIIIIIKFSRTTLHMNKCFQIPCTHGVQSFQSCLLSRLHLFGKENKPLLMKKRGGGGDIKEIHCCYQSMELFCNKTYRVILRSQKWWRKGWRWWVMLSLINWSAFAPQTALRRQQQSPQQRSIELCWESKTVRFYEKLVSNANLYSLLVLVLAQCLLISK